MPNSIPRHDRDLDAVRAAIRKASAAVAPTLEPTPEFDRGNTTQRGYGAAWRRKRKAFAEKHPAICWWPGCGAALASRHMVLDHRRPKRFGGTDEESNLGWLCRRHHAVKTARERKMKASDFQGMEALEKGRPAGAAEMAGEGGP